MRLEVAKEIRNKKKH